MTYVTRPCAIDDCDVTGQTRRGLCAMHYQRWVISTPASDRPRRTQRELFDTKTHRDEATGCLMWTASLDPAGYGRFGKRAAHRVSLEWKLGRPLLPGMFACHSCDTPGCVAPEHLSEETHQQNVNHSTAQERHAWGERNAHAVLTEVQVRAIRVAAVSGQTQGGIAKRYGVGPTAISKIVSRSNWALVD